MIVENCFNADPISQKKFRFLSAYTMQITMIFLFQHKFFSHVNEYRVLPVAQWTAMIAQCNTDDVLYHVSTDEQHYLEKKVNLGISKVIHFRHSLIVSVFCFTISKLYVFGTVYTHVLVYFIYLKLFYHSFHGGLQ